MSGINNFLQKNNPSDTGRYTLLEQDRQRAELQNDLVFDLGPYFLERMLAGSLSRNLLRILFVFFCSEKLEDYNQLVQLIKIAEHKRFRAFREGGRQ